LKLTCILLDICGTLFITGAAKKKLDSFMLYFQVGLWLETEIRIYYTRTTLVIVSKTSDAKRRKPLAREEATLVPLGGS
jgi:hypothetical protein